MELVNNLMGFVRDTGPDGVKYVSVTVAMKKSSLKIVRKSDAPDCVDADPKPKTLRVSVAPTRKSAPATVPEPKSWTM